jgi:phosphoglycolate phosphatase-like HAD superfamily hydrolase
MMKFFKPILFCVILALALASCNTATTEPTTVVPDALPSWKEGYAKENILDFITASVDKNGAAYIPAEERIAVFDNDGTLWAEQPVYFQLAFAFYSIKKMAPDHPEWKETQPFKAVLEGDTQTALSGGTLTILQLVAATHAGMTTTAFSAAIEDWLANDRHPKTGKPYTEMVYQPMLELLEYLRENGYKTFIVSGGGIDFMRVWAQRVYGIPPYQIVGSSAQVSYAKEGGKPVLIKQAEIAFIDDKEGKPIGIHQHIGKQPVLTVGNSDGDYAMIEWTTSREDLPSLGIYIHHTDYVREWAYDRTSHIGQLNMGLDSASAKGWLVVDMKEDWMSIWPH